MSNYVEDAWAAVKHIIQYLIGTKLKLIFKRSGEIIRIQAWADTSHGITSISAFLI